MAITAEQKRSVVEEFGQNGEDTGNHAVQVALLSLKIGDLQSHFATHKKDHASRRGLLAMVNRRRRLLDYLKRSDFSHYKKLIQRLGLRH